MPDTESHEHDLAAAFEWLDALERRVGKLEGMTEVIIATRADVATIAEGIDPTLAAHVSELADTVENHGLLLARLLDRDAEDRAGADFDREHPPATCDVCGDILNAEDMPEHRQRVHGAT